MNVIVRRKEFIEEYVEKSQGAGEISAVTGEP